MTRPTHATTAVLAVAGAVVGLLILVPVLLFGTVMAIASPAHQQQVATDCATTTTTTTTAPGPGALPTGPWRPPVQQGYVLTSPYGMRTDPITGIPRMHRGQDLATQPAPGPIVAASAGIVTHAGWDPYGLGTSVFLAHPGGITTEYGHMSALDPAITIGARVYAGQRLGQEGSTGHSTGNHLHYQVAINGTTVDPVPFMAARGAPLDGRPIAPSPPPTTPPSTASPATGATPGGGPGEQGGLRFPLPAPGSPILQAAHNPPLPIPPRIKALYVAAGSRYGVPWTLLAGIGMEETGHGRLTATSAAGADGLMQFLPTSWTLYGVDGDGDGRADIGNDADSIHSAANLFTTLGVTTGPDGVRRALYGYNHANWYVNDVLTYAHAYATTPADLSVPGDPTDCGPDLAGLDSTATITPPPPAPDRLATALATAGSHAGQVFVAGTAGPDTWDAPALVKTAVAFAAAGIAMPRTTPAQRNWLAAANGIRIPPGHEHRGDLTNPATTDHAPTP